MKLSEHDFYIDRITGRGLTFDDVLIEPAYSDVLLEQVDMTTLLADKIGLKVPIVSSPMDTVTEHSMAVSMSEYGGLGVIHRNMSVQQQVEEVTKTKGMYNWIVENPITVQVTETISQVRKKMSVHGVHGFPVVSDGLLIGIITETDIRFNTNDSAFVGSVMTRDPIVLRGRLDRSVAMDMLRKHKLEKMPVVDDEGRCIGMASYKGIERMYHNEMASMDKDGRLLVGASVGVGKDETDRASALVQAGADVLFIDTAHGHSKGTIEMLRYLKKHFEVPVVAGNVATAQGAQALVEAGADAIKVGIGPGSICTTRIVSGVGVPQLSAIYNCAHEANKRGVPVIADGGIRSSGDIAKAIGMGASAVMIGSLLAGTEQAPGELFTRHGRPYKSYRGMGSLCVINQRFAANRYHTSADAKMVRVPEGIEASVPYKGCVAMVLDQLAGGLRVAMGYAGCHSLERMKQDCKFVYITSASYRESHVHDVEITKQAPNYNEQY